MEEITLSRYIKIRYHPNFCIVHTHCRELRYTPVRTDARIVEWPVGLVGKAVVSVGIRVQIGDEANEPVFHVLGERDIVGI